jgi:NTE family protein
MAFHLGCLRALDDLGILEKIGVLSTISGGSVIGAYYAYTPDKPFCKFESDVRLYLRNGFHRKIVAELMRPNNLLPCMADFICNKGAALIGRVTPWEPEFKRHLSRTDIFHNVLKDELFPGLMLNSPRRNNIEVVVGACELRTGSAFRFSSAKSGGWRHGESLLLRRSDRQRLCSA